MTHQVLALLVVTEKAPQRHATIIFLFRPKPKLDARPKCFYTHSNQAMSKNVRNVKLYGQKCLQSLPRCCADRKYGF